jgi:TolB-like protein
MLRLVLAILAALPLAGLPTAAAAAPPAARPKLALLEVKAGQGLEPKAGATLTAILAADAARAGFEVISQADIGAMLAFQKQRQMLGCSDDGCLAELGGALGADYVLSGEAARVASRDHLTLTLLDAKRAKVLGRSAGFSPAGDDELAVAAQQRLRVLIRQERPDLAALMPPVVSPAEARLRGRRSAAWWTLGAGGALLAGGAVAGLLARSQASDLEGAWPRADYQARYDRQRRTALTADVLLGAGALTGGVGAWLWLSSTTTIVALPVAAGGAPGLTLAGRF